MIDSNILIIEDDVLVADNVAFILNQAGYKNTFISDSLNDVLNLIKKIHFTLIISDINLHGINNGLEVVRAVQKKVNAPAIYLTAYSDEHIVTDTLSTNSIAFILKPFTDRQLLVNVQIAFKYIQELSLTGEIDRPTKREIEIIEFVAKGLSNKEIADSLFLSEHTVKAHRRNLIKKYTLRSSSELVAMAIRLKWIQFR